VFIGDLPIDEPEQIIRLMRWPTRRKNARGRRQKISKKVAGAVSVSKDLRNSRQLPL
jgi:hypothetical protein